MQLIDLFLIQQLAIHGRRIAECAHLGRIAWTAEGAVKRPQEPAQIL